MKFYICNTCGCQYPASKTPPDRCKICDEERQFVNPAGQSWTALHQLVELKEYKNEINKEEENLYSIHTNPRFAIGQHAYLVRQSNIHLLWDCITYLDDKTIHEINQLGGIDAIALSHPHYYSTQVEWAEKWNVPIYIHEDDKEWITRPSDKIKFWSGEQFNVTDGLTIHRLGGHFKGGSVLHCEKAGVVLSGDIIQVVADPRWVSFMYSYPNLIPLPAFKVEEMAKRMKPLKFDRLYNAFHGIVKEDANEAVQRSAKRYIEALEGKLFNT